MNKKRMAQSRKRPALRPFFVVRIFLKEKDRIY